MTDAPFGSSRWPAVDAVELIRIVMPLVQPHVWAGGREPDRDVVLLRAIDADGTEGWGECSALSSPGYMSETTDDAWDTLRDELVPAWLAGQLASTARPMAHAAVEMAALDIDLRQRDASLVRELAAVFGPSRPRIEWCAVLGLHATPDDVDDAVRAGASQVKLKVTRDDLSHVQAVRAAYPDLRVAVDANGCYSSVAAVPQQLADLDLAYVEQPLAPDDLRGAAAVAEHLGIRVALDESITSSARLLEAVEVGACSIVSVKAARLGGIVEATRTMQVAAQAGLDVFVGGMLETAIGRAAALAIGAQVPCTLPCDAGPTSRYFTHDLAPAFEPDVDGRLTPPDRPGLGVTPDPETLARHRVERVLLRA